MKYVASAFSLQMIESTNYTIHVEEVDALPDDLISIVGHRDTADILKIPYNRTSITLNPEDELYVIQFVGGRLPEGTTTLPKQSKFVYRKLTYTCNS